jgi:D-alanyl-D-alanine carboxypeptidase/D-alanyl-D-alanine-endopeptidase (penicillin-binding protein 4)
MAEDTRRPLTRRRLLARLSAGLAAGAGAPAFALAPATSLRPEPRPGSPAARRRPSAEALVAASGLSGAVSFALADAETGDLLEARQPDLPQPPASTLKAITALYALDRLGPGHRFATRLLAAGPLRDGRLDGDLILAGSGDPTLQTNALADLAARAKAAGLREVTGAFRVWPGALPRIEEVDPGQPPHVGYNPAVSGLNLNFNRVHFEWRRSGTGYAITMDARSDRYRPEVRVARMRVADRTTPVYTYSDAGDVDEWTVARGALGSSGARWLPVREPALYAGEVFQTFARSQGIALGPPERVADLPAEATALATVESDPLRVILRDMLRYSTNITAEAVGLAATAALGPPPRHLAASGSRMADWLAAGIASRRPDFVDHSGLGDASRVSARDMALAMVRLGPGAGLAAVLRELPFRDADYRPVPGSPIRIEAKTGTLNFVSALSGYVTAPGGRRLAFAILTSDLERRAAIPPSQRDAAPGASGWAGRSRRLQMRLIDRWAAVHDAET